jgi:hypothetical protein
MDPRVKTPLAGLEQQFRLETRLASMMNSAYEAAGQAHSLREQLEKLSERGSSPLTETILTLQKKVTSLLGKPVGFIPPLSPEVTLVSVSNELRTLYGEIGRGDAAPTASQVSAVAEVESDLSGVMTRWNAVKTTDFPTLSRQVKNANLPEIRLEQGAEPEQESEDEE